MFWSNFLWLSVLYPQEGKIGRADGCPEASQMVKKEIEMRTSKRVLALLMLLPFAAVLGCGSQSSQSSSGLGGQPQSASVFTVATDASLPSVVSCQITVNTVTLFNGTTNVSVLSAPVLEDFAKLNGLHDLLDLSSVPTGTYTSATLTLGTTASIGYIDTTVNPPAIHTISGTLSPSMVTVPLAKPFTLNDADLVGLRMEFDIAASLATDGSGQITGAVNPIFHMKLLNADDADVSVDDFRGGYVGAAGNNSFVMQGPRGRQWTVTTDNTTDFDTGDHPASFTTDSVVDVSGQLDRVTKMIDASEISLLSDNKFLLGGLLTSVRPPTAAASEADLYIRSELPAISGINPGQITTLTLDGSEVYKIANLPIPLTALVFNNSALAAGQHVAVGGVLNTVGGITSLIPHRIVLARQGQAGSWVPASTLITAGNNGSFQLTDNSADGVLLPNPLTILTTGSTNFVNLSGLSALSGTATIKLRVVGLILIDSNDPYTHTSGPVMVARRVEQIMP
jgi:hypothetical protein